MDKGNSIKKSKLVEYGFVLMMTIVPFVYFLIFYVYVNFNSIKMAFEDEITGTFTLRYFEIFWGELNSPTSVISESLINTLKFFVLDNIIIFPLSLFFSYLLYKKIAGYKYFRIIFFLPSIISAVVLTTLYRYILNGPISEIMAKMLNMETPPLLLNSEKYALSSIMFYKIWLGIGMNMVIHSGTLSRIPGEIVDSCKIDGAGFYTEFITMSIPLIWPTLSTLILLNIVGIFGASGPILLFTQGEYGTSTIAYWIYRSTVITPNYNYASAVGLVFTLVGLPIVFMARWLMNKVGEGEEF